MLFLSLYPASDEILINNDDENVIPLEERHLQAIEMNENICRNPNSSPDQIIRAQLQLIVYYYYAPNPDYDLVRRLCLSIINNPNINPQHAPYFLGELYFYGQGVERDLQIAADCYNLLLAQENIDNILLIGPCGYKSFAQYRINHIEND